MSPKVQTGSASGRTDSWIKRVESDIQQCRTVLNKKAPAGRWGTHHGKATPQRPFFLFLLSILWWPLAAVGNGQMDLTQVVCSFSLIPSWYKVSHRHRVRILSQVFRGFFNKSINYSSGQQWIRISDNKGKSWSLFCLEKRNMISLKKLGHVFVNSVFRIKKCTF